MRKKILKKKKRKICMMAIAVKSQACGREGQ